jgi:hypothetical protein
MEEKPARTMHENGMKEITVTGLEVGGIVFDHTEVLTLGTIV